MERSEEVCLQIARNPQPSSAEIEEFNSLCLSLLTEEYASPARLVRVVEALFPILTGNDDCHSTIRPRALFLAFSILAEGKDFERASELLARTELRSVLTASCEGGGYGIPADAIGSVLRLHKVGTSSFVLKSEDQETRALKLIKPWYWKNERIARATEGYRNEFVGLGSKLWPTVHCSMSRAIVMDFIKGQTLSEFLSALRARFVKDPERRIGVIRDILTRLCASLLSLAEHKRCHLDLSSANILVDNVMTDGEWIPEIHLIDFGINYLLAERIGFTADLVRAELYMAPEQLRGEPEKRFEVDLYALGMIALECLSERVLTRENIEEELSIIRSRYPQLGDLIEDLLDPAWQTRFYEKATPEKTYLNLSERFSQLLKVYGKVYSTERNAAADVIAHLTKIPPLGGYDTLFDLVWRVLVVRRNNMSEVTGSSDSLRRSALCQLFHVAILFLFVYFLVEEWGTPNCWTNLLGRMVGLSFGLVATKYYQSMFASLEPGEGLFAMHFSCWSFPFVFGIPIIIAMIRPAYWPYCSCAGSVLVAQHNLTSYLVARRAMAGFYKNRAPTYLKERKKDMRLWIGPMAGYGLGLMAIGALLDNGVLHDEAAYAIIVAWGVNVKLYFHNCSAEAPSMKAALSAWIFAVRKMTAIRRLKIFPS